MKPFKQYIKEEEDRPKSWWVIHADVKENPAYKGPKKSKSTSVEITAPIEWKDKQIKAEIERRYPQYKVVDTSKYESNYDRSIEGE